LAATVREQRTRARRRQWTGIALAIAAVLVAAFGLRSALKANEPSTPAPDGVTARYGVTVSGTGADIARAGAAQGSATADALHVGDRVTAGADGVAVLVATGTKLALDDGASVAVVEEGRAQIFALRAGNLRADVAKLHEGERFLIRTADTEVEVRGTSFRVEHVDAASSCHPDLHTRVVVSEGVVVVRHAGAEERVGAGEQWPAPCAVAPSAGASSAPSPTSPSTAQTAGPPASTVVPPASSASKLAAANALFLRAEGASKSGDPRGAVALFDRLLADYPSTPIAESATVERMRDLDKFDRARAVSAARDYLARFPRGFARAEAEAIVALSP
ncbi:MAG: hypothetical protein JWO86_450, partial [Myxococcaceae bacterium]|nr:hypothetical protein [Myxococcaceae bacterium]